MPYASLTKFVVLQQHNLGRIFGQYNYFKAPLASADSCSKAVVLLLFILCLFMLPLFVGTLC